MGLSHKEDKNELTKWKDNISSLSLPLTHISGRACFVGLVLDKKDIYLFGLNNFGQLGVGHQENLDKPTLLRIDPLRPRSGHEVDQSIGESQVGDYDGTTDDGREVRILCCAGVHTICVLGNNECWVCGYNTYGQLGLGTKQDTYRPQRLTFFEERGLFIKDVVCGDYHSIFLTEDHMFSCGKNGSGQLGLGCNQPRIVPEEILFFRGKNVTHISCGENHTIVVVDEKFIYGFGTNSRGQLGLGSTNQESSPTSIPIPTTDPIKLLQCGRNFTILVTIRDQIIVFGDNSNEQLAFDNTNNKYIKQPKIISFPKLPLIVNVSCGEYHAMFLVSNIPYNDEPDIDALKNILTKYDEEKHSELFDGEIVCKDKTIKVIYKLFKRRCPPLFSEIFNSNKTCTVNFDSETFDIVLHYVYIDRLPAWMNRKSQISMQILFNIISLYSWLEDNGGPTILCNLLLNYLVGCVNDETSAQMLIHLDKISKQQSNKFRRHLLAYFKSKIDQNNFDNILDNNELSQSLLREILTRGGKESLIISNNDSNSRISLREDMEQMLFDNDEGDITVIYGPKSTDFLRAHKAILAFGINKYMAQFTNGMKDQSTTTIDLFSQFIQQPMNKEEEEDLTQLLKNFLKFIYTGILEVTETNAVSIINIWDHMSIPMDHPLYETCIKVVTNGVDEMNVLEILKLVLPEKSHIFPELEKRCISVCARNWKKLNETYGLDIMNYISYEQYVAITKKYLKMVNHHQINH